MIYETTHWPSFTSYLTHSIKSLYTNQIPFLLNYVCTFDNISLNHSFFIYIYLPRCNSSMFTKYIQPLYLEEAAPVCCWRPQARMKSVHSQSPGSGTTFVGRQRLGSSGHWCWPEASPAPSGCWAAVLCLKSVRSDLPLMQWVLLVRHSWSFVN